MESQEDQDLSLLRDEIIKLIEKKEQIRKSLINEKYEVSNTEKNLKEYHFQLEKLNDEIKVKSEKLKNIEKLLEETNKVYITLKTQAFVIRNGLELQLNEGN